MNSLASDIAREIQQDGPMTCARFMELALYAPSRGYYERQREIGQRGDFFTSVSVGSVFGELLAFQFAAWLKDVPHPIIVEAGAHQGRLAADILAWMQEFQPALFERLQYCLVERSETHRAWQRETLQPWERRIRWFTDIEEAEITGVIFANEFFDAMPVHRLNWDAAERIWREWRVAQEGGRFVWRRGSVAPDAAAHLPVVPEALAAVLPDGYTMDVSPAAERWWASASQALREGKIITIDYGLAEQERWRPERAAGTLRAYRGHRLEADALAEPGEQDLTAHVDFAALQRAGEAAGLRTDGLWEQSAFLTRILAQTQARPGGFAPWTPARVRQFQTLTHPDHLGRAFRVLAQGRGALLDVRIDHGTAA
jgi:SAM-dependent MidA family methyltransferase